MSPRTLRQQFEALVKCWMGRLLCDIVPADVYQQHTPKTVALKTGLSATIPDDRITSVLSKDVAI